MDPYPPAERRTGKSVNVLLFQLDGKIPNLALMRIAAHHRTLKDHVELRIAGNLAAIERHLWEAPEVVYASAIFQKTRPVAERLARIYPGAILGGTGWDLGITLEQIGITSLDQDYSLYPNF